MLARHAKRFAMDQRQSSGTYFVERDTEIGLTKARDVMAEFGKTKEMG